MKRIALAITACVVLLISGCDNTPEITVEAPATYAFERNGESTVSFSGQTTRIQMAEELADALLDFDNATGNSMLEMFRNETELGEDANPFANADLNASDKSIKSKVAASADYFSANTVGSVSVRFDFETWILSQVDEVFPNQNELAAPGQPGQIAEGSTVRYINAKGLEYDQMVIKGLIGGLMLDQALNNYLSPAVLDAGTNRADNDTGTVVEGTSYTTMEHKWDEAYGYVYGTSQNPAEPNATIGQDDSFLNKYVGRLSGDEDFSGMIQEIFDAFKLGRAAIVAGEYELRDEQAEIIREKLSEIIGIRAVYYLVQAKNGLEQASPDLGAVFHDLSEGFGFIYSLQFTRKPNTMEPYFTAEEVNSMLETLLGDGEFGLWDVKPETLQTLADQISADFSFTTEQAGS